MDGNNNLPDSLALPDIPGFIMTESYEHKMTEVALKSLNKRVEYSADGKVQRFIDMGFYVQRGVTNEQTEANYDQKSDLLSSVKLFGDTGPSLIPDTQIGEEFRSFQQEIGEEVVNYFITEAGRNIHKQEEQDDDVSREIRPQLMMPVLGSESVIPIKIQRSQQNCRLPVPIKECDKTAQVTVLVEVKASRFPQKIRSLIENLKKFGRIKPATPNKTEEKDVIDNKVSSDINDIYKKALSRKHGAKCRLPMPTRVTHPPKPEPPASRIPLAFSRFPNPDKVRKISLGRRVTKALTKQVAKINWSPKSNFPHLENFFDRILGSNRVKEIHI